MLPLERKREEKRSQKDRNKKEKKEKKKREESEIKINLALPRISWAFIFAASVKGPAIAFRNFSTSSRKNAVDLQKEKRKWSENSVPTNKKLNKN